MNFDFKSDYTLESERVVLRPLVAEDFTHLLEYSLNEPEIWQYNAPGAAGPERLRQYIDTALQQKEKQLEYPYIVFDKQTGKYAGSTRFYNISPERKILEIGYTWYGKNNWGTGLNKHCKYLLLQFAFDKLGVLRVGFGANNANQRSINAMKSIGCKVEGIMRSYNFNVAGERIDAIILSIIKEEWPAVKTNLEKYL